MRVMMEHIQVSEENENENERRKRALEMKKRLFGSFYCDAGQGFYDGFRDTRSRKPKRAPKRAMIDHSYDYSEANNSAIELAKEVQAHLAPNSPSFIKSMVYTNVIRGFSLKLPKQFCHLHLPRHDTTVTLVDESGEEYKTIFLVERSALSGGWRGFSRENKLLQGDVLVFHMVRPSKFKVYIVRAHDLAEVDGALGLMNLNACPKQMDFNEKHLKPLPLDIDQDSNQKYAELTNTKHRLLVDESESDGEHLSSNTLEGVSSSGCTSDFEGRSIKNFTVMVNGFNIDSEIPYQLRAKYYDLCCSQKSFLHDNLLKNINSRLAAKIIMETISISDAIRSCKLFTSRNEYVNWDKTLEGFEHLGMNVGFLRTRLNRLLRLAFDLEGALVSKMYMEAKLEHSCAEEGSRSLESRERSKRLDGEMETWKGIAERYKLKFEKEVHAPW